MYHNSSHYYCQAHRDEQFRHLKECGYRPTRRVARNQVFSPEYLADFECYPYAITPNGFGGAASTYMARLYIVEW